MQAAVINILINLQSKQLGNYGDVKICFPLPLHSTGTDRAFKFLNMPFMFSGALKSLWTVSLLGDAPSSPIPTGRLAFLYIQWQEVLGFSFPLFSSLTQGISLPVQPRPSLLSSWCQWHNCTVFSAGFCFDEFFQTNIYRSTGILYNFLCGGMQTPVLIKLNETPMERVPILTRWWRYETYLFYFCCIHLLFCYLNYSLFISQTHTHVL